MDIDKCKVGDVVTGFCCDNCVIIHGLKLKFPPDSKDELWFCRSCRCLNVGSYVKYKVTNRFGCNTLKPIEYVEKG